MAVDRTTAAGILSAQKASDILSTAITPSFSLSKFPQVTMGKGALDQPVLTVRPTAGFVGEGNTAVKPVTDIGVGTKSMIASELAAVVVVPDNILSDSDVDLQAYMEPRIAEAFGEALDLAILFGEGAPAVWTDTTGGGLVGKAITAGNRVQNPATGTQVDLAEQLNLALAAVEVDNFVPNTVIAVPALRARLRGLRDTTGQPVYLPDYRGSGAVDTVYGLPLSFLDARSARPAIAEAVAIDTTQFVLGVRDEIKVTVSNDATINGVSMFQTDQTAFRFTFRVGFSSLLPTTTPASVYPVGVVQPKAV